MGKVLQLTGQCVGFGEHRGIVQLEAIRVAGDVAMVTRGRSLVRGRRARGSTPSNNCRLEEVGIHLVVDEERGRD